jgi:DNA-binding transcriptional ArsR family regulator
MVKKEFVLVSLDDEKAGSISKVVNNKSCKRILKYLANKDHATETEISEELKIPLSTVHYNLSELGKAGLVSVTEYHYSKKGKEMLHYKLSNKYIIIAPRHDPNILDKLKQFLPIFMISIFTALFLHLSVYFDRIKSFILGESVETSAMQASDDAKVMNEMTRTIKSDDVAIESIDAFSNEAIDLGNNTLMDNVTEPNLIAQHLPAYTNEIIDVGSKSFFSDYFAVWFLIGTFFAITIMLILSLIKNKK